MLGLGSYQGCSEALHERPVDRRAGGARMGGAATATATAKWRQMGVRSVHEALGIYTHDVHRRWGSVVWWSWARVIRGRLPVIGRPHADILHHGLPPAYERLLAGPRRGRRCTPASCAGHARRQAGMQAGLSVSGATGFRMSSDFRIDSRVVGRRVASAGSARRHGRRGRQPSATRRRRGCNAVHSPPRASLQPSRAVAPQHGTTDNHHAGRARHALARRELA
jgi:hypothetical protein